MPVESDADLAAFFNADEFGQAATFTPAAGPPSIPITVIVSRPREESPLGELGVVVDRGSVRARVSEFAGATPRGGTLVIGSESFTVTKAPLDETRRVYELGLRKQ